MNRENTTDTGTPNLMGIRFAPETQVEALVHASDTYNMLVTVMLGFLAALAAAGIALGAGALHPLLIYLILAACASCSVFSGVMVLGERKNLRERRQKLAEETQTYYVPSPFRQFNLGTAGNASPTVTLGEMGSSPAAQTAALTGSAQPDPVEDGQLSGSESDANT